MLRRIASVSLLPPESATFSIDFIDIICNSGSQPATPVTAAFTELYEPEMRLSMSARGRGNARGMTRDSTNRERSARPRGSFCLYDLLPACQHTNTAAPTRFQTYQ